MTRMETKTTEKMTYRKGISFNFIFNYFVYFFFGLTYLSLETNSSLFHLFQDKIYLYHLLILSIVAITLNIVIENIVLNSTLTNYNESKWYIFFSTFISTVTSVLIVFNWLEVIQSIDTVQVILFALIVAIINAGLDFKGFGISTVVALFLIHVFVHSYEYAISFNGDYLLIFLLTISICILDSLVKKMGVHLFKKKIFKNLLKPQTYIHVIMYMFFLLFSFLFTYLISLYMLQALGYIQIISFKEVLISFLGYFLLISKYNFSLQSIRTKKETHTQRMYYV